MKKVSLLILLVIVASTLMMAAIPTKMMRLTIINKSGSDVYMKLEGSAITEAYYYLTVPAGTRDEPTIKVFTVMSDVYKRTTWQCEGVRSSGQLIVDGNIRLTFLPCGEVQCRVPWDGVVTHTWITKCGVPVTYGYVKRIGSGEPRMEKVTYFRWLQLRNFYLAGNWDLAYLYNGFFSVGCTLWYYRIRTYRLPYGCEFRYQY